MCSWSIWLICGLILTSLLIARADPAGAAAITYSYDALNRLVQVDYGAGARINYTYDAVGNRLTLTKEAPSFLLTVMPTGSGIGTVTSNPSGITCGDDCGESYLYNTSVTLTASPAFGSIFTGWSGEGCFGTGTCTVSMTQARGVTATFALQTFSLSVAGAGNGSGTVSPVGIGSSGTYNYGTSVPLTATPAMGSTFTGWSGDCTGTDSCSVTMTQSRAVTATFTLQAFSLSVTGAGNGSGTVSPVGIGNSGTYNYGTSVPLTATPAMGSTFTGWSGDCTGTGPCTVSMTQDHSVTATFTSQLPTLSLSLTKSSFHSGDILSLTATVTPGSAPTMADVYVALAIPGGTLLFLQWDGSLTTDLRPIVTNWTVGSYTGPIFTHPFGRWEPVGSYMWYAAFTTPGGNPLIGTLGPIVSAPFSFSP